MNPASQAMGRGGSDSATTSQGSACCNSHVRLGRDDELTIGLIAALAALLLTIFLPPLLHPDSDSYFESTQRLCSQGQLNDLSRHTPLYPLLLSLAGHSKAAGLLPLVLVQHLMAIGSAILSESIYSFLLFAAA